MPTPIHGLIRIHPNEGGKAIAFKGQDYRGVSPDVFVAPDKWDNTVAYWITRKLNLTIQINPNLFSTESFFKQVTVGSFGEDAFKNALKRKEESNIHGDDRTGLRAHPMLLKHLKEGLHLTAKDDFIKFNSGGVHYVFHSVGVAANQNYAAAGHRVLNDFKNRTSHFEIKFYRQDKLPPYEFLCLNIHLQATNKNFGPKEAMDRLHNAIDLFYRELGVLAGDNSKPITRLQQALSVDHMNYEEKGFNVANATSLVVALKVREAKAHIKQAGDPRGFNLSFYLPSKLTSKDVVPTSRSTTTLNRNTRPNVADEILFPLNAKR